MLVLENLGVDISALVAGLGIGGIAVALAVQSILGDLLASLSILLDKPFVIGDYLSVDDLGGTVESIGLNSTRLTSLTGEQLVFSNKDLLQSRIRNFGRMEERRVLFRIGVVYGTPPEVVEKIPGMLRSAIESHELTRFERSHFKEFGDSALIFETVYFMTVPDYGTYMDVQQAVNLDMLRRFAAQGIEFAYPTQHLYLETVGTLYPAGPSDPQAPRDREAVRSDSVDDTER
jgi:small-conductance mechanosensitive channel